MRRFIALRKGMDWRTLSQGFAMTTIHQTHHCEAVRKHNEAIYNPANQNANHFVIARATPEAIHNAESRNEDSIVEANGEIQSYRLPRDSSESLAMTKSHPLRHCKDDRTKQSITLHIKDSTMESQKSDIMDCHENHRFSRNDAVANALIPRHCEDDRTKQSIIKHTLKIPLQILAMIEKQAFLQSPRNDIGKGARQ